MRNTRRRSDRPEPARFGPGSTLETLESRTLLSATSQPFSPWIPTDLPVYTATTHQKIPFSISPLVRQGKVNAQAQFLNNEGKIVSGTDRAGDTWTITVHGPGKVIVTDITPNDGALDDDIDTIQLVGTTSKSIVTGQTTASPYAQGNGVVFFNRLIDTNAVGSVVLNGFTLTQTLLQPPGGVNYGSTGVYLLGGTNLLQFHDIIASVDQAQANAPINIQIGDMSTPLKMQPTIRLDSIFNTVFNTDAAAVPTDPQTTPTVNILVNGNIRGLDMISSTQAAPNDPAETLRTYQTPLFAGIISSPQYQQLRFANYYNSPIASAGVAYQFPKVSTTGRTAIRATGINHLNAGGSLVNVTASKGAVPFQNGLSGLDHLGAARFGGNADALGLDVRGKIGRLTFERGLGSSVGNTKAATSYGTPAEQTGFPAAGLLGGLITGRSIRRITAEPANVNLQTATNPTFVQLYQKRYPYYFARPGNALNSAAIVSAGDIGHTAVTGSLVNSEIKSGFHYPSYAAGLEGTRAKSKFVTFQQTGSLVNSNVSATYRPGNRFYGSTTSIAGPGTIHGHFNGNLFVNGNGVTALNNTGAGIWARHKTRNLPDSRAF